MLRLFSSLVSCPGCRQRPAGPAGICAGCLPLLFSLVDRPGLLALGRFEGPLKGVVTALKFSSASRLADPLGAELASQIRRRGWRPLVVTPVPLHPRRAAERGYNQAGLLAASCARQLGIPCLPLLERRRDTRQQARLPTVQRPGNSAGAFSVAAAAPKVLPRRVLLVDDVLTTGHTLLACRRVLLAAGCEQVYSAAVAVASPRRPQPHQEGEEATGLRVRT